MSEAKMDKGTLLELWGAVSPDDKLIAAPFDTEQQVRDWAAMSLDEKYRPYRPVLFRAAQHPDRIAEQPSAEDAELVRDVEEIATSLEMDGTEESAIEGATLRQAATRLSALSGERALWVYAAAEDCRSYIEPFTGGRQFDTRQHLLEMLDKIKAGMSPTKACRWLGWIQACLYCHGQMTLESAKHINKSASESFENSPRGEQMAAPQVHGSAAVEQGRSENATPAAAASEQMVPREPTREMLVALMGDPLILAASDEIVGREAYRAMLAAAPGAKR